MMDERSKEMRTRLDAMPLADPVKIMARVMEGPREPMNVLEQLDTALCEPTEPLVAATGLMKGSITFAPDQSKPCYCANCALLEQDVARLRLGNAGVIHDNQRLQHEVARLQRDLETANATIRSLETKIHLEGK